jgi:hypothetical protein
VRLAVALGKKEGGVRLLERGQRGSVNTRETQGGQVGKAACGRRRGRDNVDLGHSSSYLKA